MMVYMHVLISWLITALINSLLSNRLMDQSSGSNYNDSCYYCYYYYSL